MGTPAYMAPEQARGEPVDARADVFALGGILCATLTGGPPFAGASSIELIKKSASGNLTDALASLDACGADAELIALAKRCLASSAATRPADGAAVADAIASYRAGVAERLRQAETERAAAVVREQEGRKRRKMQLALAAAVLLLAIGGGAFAWWQEKQATSRRMDQERADGVLKAEQASFDTERKLKGEQARERTRNLLVLAVDARKEYRYSAAENNLREAGELATSLAPDMLPAVEQAKADLAFVRDLDVIRMRSTYFRGPGREGHFDEAKAPERYHQAFVARGLDVADPAAAGDRVARSAVRVEMVMALDDWVILEPDKAVRDKVLAVLRHADGDSGAAPFRDPAVWADKAKLEALAAKVDVARLSPEAVVAIAGVMAQRNVVQTHLLKQAMSLHPREFPVAVALGENWNPMGFDLQDCIGALRAARALRPDNKYVLYRLGYYLTFSRDHAGAILAHKEAIRLNPKDAEAHGQLGSALEGAGDLPGAIDAYREAIRLDPKDTAAHTNVAMIFGNQKNYPEAIVHARAAVEANPKYAGTHLVLGHLLKLTGDIPGARAALTEAARLDKRWAGQLAKLPPVEVAPPPRAK